MTTGSPIPAPIRAAAVTDYQTSPDPLTVVAARHGVSKAALWTWVKQPDPRKRIRDNWTEEEVALNGGHWIPNTRGVQVWQPCFYDNAQTCTINHHGVAA